MGKRTEKEKQKVIKYSSNNLSQEQMVEIQAEAYYRALKRIDNEKLNEKTNDEEISEEKRKNTWYENLLFILVYAGSDRINGYISGNLAFFTK